jgi:predicted secreted protein
MAGYAGLGTILRIDTGSGHGRLVAELTSIGGPSISLDTIDVSSHDSEADDDSYRTYVGGLIDGGEVSLEGNLAELADADEIQGALDDRDELGFEIEFPTGDMWEFDGIVTAFETLAPHDGKLGFSASLKITGQPVLT